MSEKMNPSKRLKNWHRKYGRDLSLRQYARLMLGMVNSDSGEEVAAAVTAKQWLDGKARRP